MPLDLNTQDTPVRVDSNQQSFWEELAQDGWVLECGRSAGRVVTGPLGVEKPELHRRGDRFRLRDDSKRPLRAGMRPQRSNHRPAAFVVIAALIGMDRLRGRILFCSRMINRTRRVVVMTTRHFVRG